MYMQIRLHKYMYIIISLDVYGRVDREYIYIYIERERYTYIYIYMYIYMYINIYYYTL